MQNMMKPETPPIINELASAGLRTVMVTGDNLLTALCVARKCGMVAGHKRVILIEAHAEQHTDESERPARIEWKMTEDIGDVVDEPSGNMSYQARAESKSDDLDCTIHTVLNMTDDSYCFAMDGKSFCLLRRQFPKTLEKILLYGTVYARMSPEQKAQLVESLMAIGYCVSMCGDGANDCAALKAAHVGISLSEAEASVASPFTSKIQNISCVPEVIK